MDTSFDPAKVEAAAEKLLNQLAKLVQASFDGWGPQSPRQKAETGNAVALIMSLRKDVDGPDTIP